jgi:hypothetical protein
VIDVDRDQGIAGAIVERSLFGSVIDYPVPKLWRFLATSFERGFFA